MAAPPALTLFLVKGRNMKFAGLFLVFFGLLICQALADTSEHDFIVREKRNTRLCLTKKILTVNGKFPGETIYARKGDTVIVRVHNKAKYNVTIHWHGLSQPRNPWSDGPEYITQCPIQPGANFTYRLFFSEEEGTIWWHAHSGWDRATVHGAIIVHPRKGTVSPYRKPYKEIPIILGEWWKADVREVIAESIQTGAGANISDAFTINGQPGDLYPCSNQSTFTLKVKHGKTYLLRVINAAITTEFFFAIAGHRLTVVGNDASYTKPYTVDFIMITPGQTYDLLVKADSNVGGRYYIAARSYSSTVGIPFDNTTTTAVLEYAVSANTPAFPFLPDYKNTTAASQFVAGVRSLATEAHPVDVPQTIDERILITVSVNLLSCEPGRNCSGPNGDRLSASLNNISFVTPTTDLLEAYYKNTSGVFGTGFPDQPPLFFNFTGENLPGFLLFPKTATEVRVVEYNTSLEIVFQGTNLLARENHPMHLHGNSFYVVGRGFGNFDKDKDPLNYNLVDPAYKNTVGVARSGWAAIRFRAQNPGVWFMHCHLDQHMVWGMNTVFIVKNGNGPKESLLPPPPDMPPC
ncbi:putative laccase-9 [Platanthera guangdongensis]|uniref:Laccase n=1 Tax=Platanthera guangdongensis TaxID=2320717 RepID=A0ABR2MFV0_9ASPA